MTFTRVKFTHCAFPTCNNRTNKPIQAHDRKIWKNPQRKTQQTKPITTAQVRLTSKQALVTVHLSHTVDRQTDGHIRFNRRSTGTGPRNACVIMEKCTFLKKIITYGMRSFLYCGDTKMATGSTANLTLCLSTVL